MALDDISSTDLDNHDQALPVGMTLSELYAPKSLRAFWNTWLPRTKLLKKGLISITSTSQIHRFIEKEKIDVLMTYNLPQLPLLKQAECPTHFDLADDLVAMLEGEHDVLARVGAVTAAGIAQRKMLETATTVTVASSVLADQIDRPLLMLPNGADIEELDQADGSVWRSHHVGPTVGFVGAFEYWVDFELVLRLAQRLRSITFLLVGGGRRWKTIKQLVDYLGLKNVVLTGALPYAEAMNYVAGMDICLLPFTRDAVSDGSCPLKLFEYAALRKPIVSTVTREVMRIGEGWITFAEETDGFVEAINLILANKGLAQQYGEAGRALVESYYNWPNLAAQFADLLRSGLTAESFEYDTNEASVFETINSRA